MPIWSTRGAWLLALLTVSCAEDPLTSLLPDGRAVDARTLDAAAPDAHPVDAATPDAAAPDATAPDAATPDATTPDATTPDATTPDAATPDAATADLDPPDEPPPPARPPVDPPVTPTRRDLLPAPVRAVALLPEGALADTPQGLVRLGPAGAEPLGPPGLRGAATVGAQPLILDGSGALMAWTEAGLTPSPLPVDDALELVAWPADTLWISTPGGLLRWRAGQLGPVAALGPGEAPARGLTGGWWGAAPALWSLTADGAPAALTWDAAGLTRWRMPDAPAGITALAADGDGGIHALAGGALWRFDGARWARLPLGGRFRDLAAHPEAPDLWLTAHDGTVWHSAGGRFRPTRGLPVPRWTGADAGGALWILSAEGLHQALLGRLVILDGLADGARLDAEATIQVEPTDPQAVRAVTVALDGGPPAAVAGPPWRLTVGPAAGPGAHQLTVEVTWDDDEVAQAQLRFEVPPPPSWRGEVEALHTAACVRCHAARLSPNTPLDGLADWRLRIDRILIEVQAGRMPLGADPLSQDQIALLVAWRAAGMPEE